MTNKTNLLFTKDGAWYGGNIGIHLHCSVQSRRKARRLFSALWSLPEVRGCFLNNELEPEDQKRVSPSHVRINRNCYGYVDFQEGKKVCCYGMLIDYGKGDYWASMWFPIGSINSIYDTQGYPFGNKEAFSSEWLMEFTEHLKNFAYAVYQIQIFDFGAIGYEVNELSIYQNIKPHSIPDNRLDGYLITEDGKLIWYPPTSYEPLAYVENSSK